ncbi:MAG: SIMPL domain-containing protein, partial [Burkholderiaceae bacterium]
MVLSIQKRKWFFGVLAGVGASLLMLTASAQEHSEDQLAAPSEPQLTLSAHASAEVAQDTVKITLASELVGAAQASVAAKLGKMLDSVLKQAKTNPKIRVSSGNYRVWPVNDKNGKISNWHGRG